MADKQKMSVAEILAAARKADSQGGAKEATEPPADGAPAEAAPVAESAPAVAGSPPKKIAKPGAAGRPSVSEMMALARAEQAGGAKPAAEPAAAKAAPAKPAPAAKPAAVKAAAPAKPAERDTASILATARKGSKPGPMSKAQAAAKAKADPTAAPAKPKVVVPPMPAKPAYAKPQAAVVAKKQEEPAEESRRSFLNLGFWMLGLVSALWALATVKFMFPNVRREPPSKFKVGFPDAFPAEQVQDKFKAQYGVWVVNTEYNGQQEIFALKSVCTHLGCTPNWLEAEQKFKCPCHGSGFYRDGINFEGPAPRPLERYAIRLAEDGQIEIDKSKTFQEEMGQWTDPTCYIPV
jgi:cytochrome b6-f complex iron-sulfur subunit